MIVDGQLLRHELGPIKWEEMGEFGVVAKRKNSSRWTSLRQEIFRPEVSSTVPFPCPGLGPIATKSVDEDDTVLLAKAVCHKCGCAYSIIASAGSKRGSPNPYCSIMVRLSTRKGS
jgi:hypothetical protein